MWSSFSAYLIGTLAGVSQAEDSSGWEQLSLQPSSTYRLASAHTTIDLPNGALELWWQRSGGQHFDQVAAGDAATLSCGEAGGTITSVEFASFGTPRSGPDFSDLRLDPTCHAPRSADIIAAACIGQQACSIDATAIAFELGSAPATQRICHRANGADPLRLLVAVRCSSGESLRVRSRIPVGSRATLSLPLYGAAATPAGQSRLVLQMLGGTVLFPNRPSDASTPGVGSVRLVDGDREGGDARIEVQLAAGSYDLTLA